jgi:hypothetical protein
VTNRKPANAKTGEVIHKIEVPEKFAKHRERYIRGYMEGYIRIADALAARRRSLEGPKKASHAKADYREHGTAERHCARCLMYDGLNKCSAVEAPISPQAVCKYFKAKVSRLMTRLRKGVDE